MRPRIIAVTSLVALVMGSAAPALADQFGTTPLNPSCAIKGNINEKGERIYHVPGDAWYQKTKVDQRLGERWFCSEAEALAAGWRPPKR